MFSINITKLPTKDPALLEILLKAESSGYFKILIPRRPLPSERYFTSWFQEFCDALYVLHRLVAVSRITEYTVPKPFNGKWFVFKPKNPLTKGLADLLSELSEIYTGTDGQKANWQKKSVEFWKGIREQRIRMNCPAFIKELAYIESQMNLEKVKFNPTSNPKPPVPPAVRKRATPGKSKSRVTSKQ